MPCLTMRTISYVDFVYTNDDGEKRGDNAHYIPWRSRRAHLAPDHEFVATSLPGLEARCATRFLFFFLFFLFCL